jgi:lysophospholipase L1-like esterase
MPASFFTLPFFSALGINLVMGFSSTTALTISADNPKLFFAPYAWRPSGAGDAARAEATLPGAYLKAAFTGSATLSLVVDGTANAGCPPNVMPVLDWSVDKGPIQTRRLSQTVLHTFPLAQGLDKATPHEVQIWLRAAGLEEHRWTASTDHLRIAGLALDDGATLGDVTLRPKRMIGFGDSITEGVGVEARFTNWGDISPNNADKTWVPLLAGALDCEYGQLGSSGLGMVKPHEVTPLPQSWSRYDAAHSKLQNGLLVPEPDYIFNNLGTNDLASVNIEKVYTQWLADVRKTAPHARLFAVVPLMGMHRDEIAAAVKVRNDAGDPQVYLIDLPELQPWFHFTSEGTALAHEGVHPTAEGHAIFATHLAMKVQKILE